MKYNYSKICFAVLLGLYLSAGLARAEKMVVINAKGQLLDLESDKVKALASEKLRITRIKQRVLKENLLPEEMVRQMFEPLVKANKEQYGQNLRNSEKFKRMAQQAADRNQEETAQKYMQVAKLFYDYSEQNKAIAQAFAKGASGDINKAAEEILTIERKIREISRKDVPREWLTPQEVQSVTVMTEKQYEQMLKNKEDMRERREKEAEKTD